MWSRLDARTRRYLVRIGLVWLLIENLYVARDVLLYALTSPGRGYDFGVLASASHAAGPTVYAGDYVWSPLALPLLAVLTAGGWGVWALAHLAALLALRRPWLIALALTSHPFWFAVSGGDVMTFVAVAGYLALRGSRPAIWLTFVLALLMPRPLMVPLVGYLLVVHPDMRRDFLLLVALNVAGIALSGLGPDWIERLRSVAPYSFTHPWNWGPSRALGGLWLPIGLALAVPLFLTGRIGLAALAVQPYWFPMYLAVLAWEFAPARSPVPRLRAVVRERRGGLPASVEATRRLAQERDAG